MTDTFGDFDDDAFDASDAEFYAAVEGTDLAELADYIHECLDQGVDPVTGAPIG